MDCGRTMAGARCQDAVQTIDYRLTGISEPCGCRCRGDQSGSCARSREHRAMRLRASSGLTQPAWKTIRCPAIRCTMARDIRRTARIARLAVETSRTIEQVPQKPKEGPRQILAGRSAWMGPNFGAGNVSSANSFRWQELRGVDSLLRSGTRLTERRPKWDRKHCLMHGEWPPAATLHASGTSCPPAPTRRCADRTRSPVRAGLTNPTEDRCQPVPPLLPPPTAVARAPGRCAVAGWIRRCGRGPCPRQ
jgi:hypothetical protein